MVSNSSGAFSVMMTGASSAFSAIAAASEGSNGNQRENIQSHRIQVRGARSFRIGRISTPRWRNLQVCAELPSAVAGRRWARQLDRAAPGRHGDFDPAAALTDDGELNSISLDP